MSEKTKPQPETQKQRWIKYGSNVALSIVVVIVLAGLITYLAQRFDRRVDTTAEGSYSLKPQTVNIIKDLKSPVKIVSLYSRPTTPQEQREAKEQTDYGQVVADLLQEYARKGKNIEVEMIDPIADPTKADALYEYARTRYGGEVGKYKAFLDTVGPQFDKIKKLALDEQEQLKNVPEQAGDPRLSETLQLVKSSLTNIGTLLDNAKERVDRVLKDKRPDYKAAVEFVQTPLQRISEFADQIDKELKKAGSGAGLPSPTTQYIAGSGLRYQQMKQLADDVVAKIKDLGELKLDDVRQKLRERDAVLVMGEKEMRSLSFDQLWQPDTTMKRWNQGQQDDKIRPRFAGEQQITTAVLSLTEPGRKKIVFIRPGGPPLTTPGSFFQEGGPFSLIADKLRDYNFEVLEKDLSGQYAMQAQMQGMPPAPEPSDEEIKDAVWVVLNLPAGDPRMGPAPQVGAKLAQHLKDGGAAMVLTFPRGEDLSDALKDWGAQNHPDTMAVHDVQKMAGAPTQDLADNVQRYPYVFVVNKFGDHMLTRPIRSLDMLLVQVCPVTTTSTAGVSASPLIPLPDVPPSWGERDLESLGGRSTSGEPPTFNKETDMPPPLFAGAALSRGEGARLVLFGSLQSLTSEVINLPDIEATRAQRRLVRRFPGNEEFFTNAIFWLAKRETLIAISPTAMEVPRIRDMSDGALNAWRIGLLLVGLPGLVIASGLIVFFARRD